jgi:tetratricopeptide (TPR) repeat protein
LFNNWALALHLSGRPIEAEKLFRRAIDISRADQAEQGVSSMLLINYARTLRVLGRPEAADYAERGYANAVQAGNQLVMNQALLVLGRIYRERGDLTRAQEMLSEVEPRLRKALPPGHLAFSRLASEYSLLASARSDLPTALQRANQAVAIAEASIKAGRGGDDYLASALVVRSDINRQLGRAGDASDAAWALALLKKSEGPREFSSDLGHAFYSMGRALQAQGKTGEARAAFRSAADNLRGTLGPDHPDTRSAHQADVETLPR